MEDTPTGFSDALPKIFAALGQQLPEDWETAEAVPGPRPSQSWSSDSPTRGIQEEDGVRRADSHRRIDLPSRRIEHPRHHQPPLQIHGAAGAGGTGGDPLVHRALLRVADRGLQGARAEDRKQRCRSGATRSSTPRWVARPPVNPDEAWRRASGSRRFSVEVDFDPVEGTPEAEAALMREAASDLLALPWEILHDGTGYPLPGRRKRCGCAAACPTASARARGRPDCPSGCCCSARARRSTRTAKPVGYIDHRAAPIRWWRRWRTWATDLVQVDILQPPTFPALQGRADKAREAGDPYEIVHFDGHGVYDPRVGWARCALSTPATRQAGQRLLDLVHADELAAELRDYNVPLIFLEACQTAQSDADPPLVGGSANCWRRARVRWWR